LVTTIETGSMVGQGRNVLARCRSVLELDRRIGLAARSASVPRELLPADDPAGWTRR